MMDTVVPALRDLIKTSCSARLSPDSVFVGNFFTPGKDECPCVIIFGRTTDGQRPHTASDQFKFQVVIRVITDRTASMSENGMPDNISQSWLALTKLIEETDTEAGSGPMVDTVLGCMMKQSNIANMEWQYNMNPKVNYDVPQPPGDFYYVFAEITLDFLTKEVPRHQ